MAKENVFLNHSDLAPGLYTGQDGDYKWDNLVIRITGTVPFLQVQMWDLFHGEIHSRGFRNVRVSKCVQEY